MTFFLKISNSKWKEKTLNTGGSILRQRKIIKGTIIIIAIHGYQVKILPIAIFEKTKVEFFENFKALY